MPRIKSFRIPQAHKLNNLSSYHIGKHWYLYERTSVYDPKIKRSRKKSGSILGKITPEGLVPSKRAAQPQSIHIDDVAEVATPVFFWDRTREIRSKLIEYFPDIWEWIYVAAFLRLYEYPLRG